MLEGSGHGKGRALIEDDQDNLGFRVRTLVTSRYRLTAYSGHSYGELFDFQEDPGELRNLWDDPAHKAVRDELRLALLDEIMDTDPGAAPPHGGLIAPATIQKGLFPCR